MNKGIVVAGNILIDNVKIIENYPQKGMLENILKVKIAVGGATSNTGIDLKIIDNVLPIKVYANVGEDKEGLFLKNELLKYGLDIENLKINKNIATSFTDVMSIKSTGERTCFHYRGANKNFDLIEQDIDKLECDIIHFGHILLLDKLDGEDKEYGTVLARRLESILKKGIKTSLDVASENSDRYIKIVKPALKYINYCILNEIEAGNVAEISARDENDKINIENIKQIATKLFEFGVRDKVVIHCPEAGFIMNKNGEFLIVPSVILPKGYIKGTVGAGDAFCAGVLYSIYNNFDDNKMLKFASLCSVCNLSEEDSVSGMKKYSEIIKLENLFKRREL